MWHSHLRVIASAITADRGPLALVLRARDKEFRVHGGKRFILEVVKTRPIRASVAHLARVACRSGRCRATCARMSRISTSGQSYDLRLIRPAWLAWATSGSLSQD